MLADYFNNPLMPMSCSGMSEKWYEVARTREKRLFNKMDVFMYLSATKDNAFDLVYVSIDEINRRLTKCYHGKFVVRKRKNCLIIRQGLWRKRFFVVACDEEPRIVALSNKRKSKIWILAKKLPYDKGVLEKIKKSLSEKGFDLNSIEFYYE